MFAVVEYYRNIRGWRNWQTRMIQAHIAQAVRVQVPSLVPSTNMRLCWNRQTGMTKDHVS